MRSTRGAGIIAFLVIGIVAGAQAGPIICDVVHHGCGEAHQMPGDGPATPSDDRGDDTCAEMAMCGVADVGLVFPVAAEIHQTPVQLDRATTPLLPGTTARRSPVPPPPKL